MTAASINKRRRVRKTADAPRIRVIERPQGHEDLRQRFLSREKFGGVTATDLGSILTELDQGKVRRWVELCSWAISSDSDLLSLYESRVERVVQADWVIGVPEEHRGDPRAELQAELVDELVGKIRGFQSTMRFLLDAIATGFSAAECIYEYDRVRRLYWVREMPWRHSTRFRYGPNWDRGVYRDLRLYDRGLKIGEDSYGERLTPGKWVVHFHVGKAEYPSHFGLMRAGIWWWVFRRWNMKGWLNYSERFGVPTIMMTFPPDTPESVKTDARENLEQMAYDSSVIVTEEGVEYQLHEHNGTGKDVHDLLDRRLLEGQDKLWLGSSDITNPGAHGSQSAVEGRISATADPRMVVDGSRLMETLRHTLFTDLLQHNLWRLGSRPDEVIAPVMRLKTADDEIAVDESDRREEQRVAQEVDPQPELPAEPTDANGPEVDDGLPASIEDEAAAHDEQNIQKEALNGAQISSMKDLLISAASGELPVESVRAMMVAAFPGVDPADIDQMLQPVTDRGVPELVAPEPTKASRSPLALVLSGKYD